MRGVWFSFSACPTRASGLTVTRYTAHWSTTLLATPFPPPSPPRPPRPPRPPPLLPPPSSLPSPFYSSSSSSSSTPPLLLLVLCFFFLSLHLPTLLHLPSPFSQSSSTNNFASLFTSLTTTTYRPPPLPLSLFLHVTPWIPSSPVTDLLHSRVLFDLFDV